MILKNTIRDSDTVARIGGDKFTIIIDKFTSYDYIVDVIQKIMKNISIPHYLDDKEFFTSFSIGVSVYPDDGDDADTLLKNSDAAMYNAKDLGKNTYQFYTHDMTEKALQHMLLESSLRQAIENSELEVYYQAQIDARDDTIVGMEALVGWKHPEKGYISPVDFIPLAETTGLITDIDIFVMQTSIAQFMKWKSAGEEVKQISINMSVMDFVNKKYLKALKQMIKESSCDTKWIELEITESQIMKNPDLSIKELEKLNDMGINLSIDDFGTGYSSLSYLKKLPINKLKIDKSFIDEIEFDKDDQEITKTIIAMAQNLNLNVIAEGVETKEQKELLLGFGCNEIQGYYYYKPMSAEDMTHKVLKSL